MQNITLLQSIFADEIRSLANGAQVVSCARDTPLTQVIQIMAERNIGCIVVTENGRPVGIFTERDLLRKVVPHKLNLDQELIEKHMTLSPVSIGMETEIIKAMTKMTTGNFRHLVLTDDEGMLTGVVSVKDLLHYLVGAITQSLGDPNA